MNSETDINDLLKMVDPKLQENYWKGELASKGAGTLAELNDEYKKIQKKLLRMRAVFKNNLLVFIILWVSIIVAGWAAHLFVGPPQADFYKACSLVLVVLLVPCMLIQSDIHGKKQDKLFEARDHIRCKLEDFEKVIEALKGSVGHTMREYSAASIRGNLLEYAMQIVDAERKLDKIRFQKERRVDDMERLCRWIQERGKQYRNAGRAAKMLGLEFDNTELFKEAEARLDSPVS